jgi:hypothetical protein
LKIDDRSFKYSFERKKLFLRIVPLNLRLTCGSDRTAIIKREQFAGGTRNFKYINISTQKVNKRVLGGTQRGSILIWGYAKGLNIDLGVRE